MQKNYAENTLHYVEISTVNKILMITSKQQWNKKHFEVLPTI